MSKFARQSVKVALTGDGADELLVVTIGIYGGRGLKNLVDGLCVSSKFIELATKSSALNY